MEVHGASRRCAEEQSNQREAKQAGVNPPATTSGGMAVMVSEQVTGRFHVFEFVVANAACMAFNSINRKSSGL
jgi:hypothetical protein